MSCKELTFIKSDGTSASICASYDDTLGEAYKLALSTSDTSVSLSADKNKVQYSSQTKVGSGAVSDSTPINAIPVIDTI